MKRSSITVQRIPVLLLMTAALALPVSAGKKKSPDKQQPKQLTPMEIIDHMDKSMIVWPNPPAITRVRYLDMFYAEKRQEVAQQKAGWMDRLAGVTTGENLSAKRHFQLVQPYGMATDSKGRVYVADTKVGAVFIFSPESRDVELIKSGVAARFGLITGLAIDDSDKLFLSDSGLRRVLVFDPQHKVQGSITEGLSTPAGLAIDNENRFLYVCDTDLDQVLVFNADSPYQLLRKIGTAGKKHTLTAPGELAVPTNVAVDADGNVYISDTLNDRVQIFDADGNFIRTFGKPGDGPGYFARPKGITVDGDGHVWVADTVQDRVQVFDQHGRLLLYMGGHGWYPGQFRTLAGLAFDPKTNRVFTSEQYPGRVQMFRYVTDEEAAAEKARRDLEAEKKKGGEPTGDTTKAGTPATQPEKKSSAAEATTSARHD